MMSLEKLLKDYETDIECWESDFGEGHLFLAHREALVPYEEDERVMELDRKAMKIVEDDNSQGSDRLFLEKLKELIEHSMSVRAA